MCENCGGTGIIAHVKGEPIFCDCEAGYEAEAQHVGNQITCVDETIEGIDNWLRIRPADGKSIAQRDRFVFLRQVLLYRYDALHAELMARKMARLEYIALPTLAAVTA